MCKKKLIIFDLDDTLIDTSDVYWQARSAFVKKIVEEVLIEENTLIEEFEKIDHIYMAKLGFSPYRYEKSMLVTYKLICNKFQRSTSKRTISYIKSCGQSVRENIPKLIKGAENILEWASKNYIVGLITRGHCSWQMQKVCAVGINDYFEFINVVSKKDVGVFRQAILDMEFPVKDTWIVGDSIKSDINPGLEIGANCILYNYKHPHYHWRQDYEPNAIGHFYKVNKLEDIRQLIEN
jgi:putative hydrolase of the HAD superfamily